MRGLHILGGINIGIPHEVRGLAVERLKAEFQHDERYIVVQLGYVNSVVTIEWATAFLDIDTYHQFRAGVTVPNPDDVTERARNALHRASGQRPRRVF